MDWVDKAFIAFVAAAVAFVVTTLVCMFMRVSTSMDTAYKVNPSDFRKDIDIYYVPNKKEIRCYNKTDNKLYRDKVPCF